MVMVITDKTSLRALSESPISNQIKPYHFGMYCKYHVPCSAFHVLKPEFKFHL